MAEEREAVAGARWAVVVLTSMNLLNYLDRFVPSAVKDLFKPDLGLTDAQTSYPLTAFVVVYMLTSPIFGSLADRWPRKWLIAAGVGLWSLATAAAALATGFWSFLFARALVGVGEAAYATLAPPLLADFFPPERRNRILTIFYVAIPVGAALGFGLGGFIGAALGWRAAFLICGAPGIVAALAALRIRDPGRGRWDVAEAGGSVSWPAALRRLASTPTYVYAVAGYTAVTFAAGGMADWFPTYLVRYRGMDVASAGTLIGTVTVVGGLAGTASGGYLADRLRRVTRNSYLALSAVSMVPAATFAALALVVPAGVGVAVCMFLAQFFLWFYNGPVNTLIANAVGASLRARAFALSILCIHLLGDAISPPIIGAISDSTGTLLPGVALVPVFMLLGALIWGTGWRRLPEVA
jgi:predicted MFS family arabinose efflux permease